MMQVRLEIRAICMERSFFFFFQINFKQIFFNISVNFKLELSFYDLALINQCRIAIPHNDSKPPRKFHHQNQSESSVPSFWFWLPNESYHRRANKNPNPDHQIRQQPGSLFWSMLGYILRQIIFHVH